MLWFMRSQRVGHDRATELNTFVYKIYEILTCRCDRDVELSTEYLFSILLG